MHGCQRNRITEGKEIMQSIGEALKKMIPPERLNLERISNLTEKERLQRAVDNLNSSGGDLNEVDGYNCKKCRNKGVVFFLVESNDNDGNPVYRESSAACQCMAIRKSIRRMKASGLENIIKKCTFDKYEANEEWQKKIKESAKRFSEQVNDLENKWFFIGGGNGTGKTHLCTAISRELLYSGKAVKYMLWVDESTKLKSLINDDEKYGAMLNELKTAEVLYIDDFFKIIKDGYGKELLPTAADIKLAYEIINYRYQHHELITIISSERYIGEIEGIDSAVGSRIYEMTKDNAYNISRDKKRNYRIRGMEII